ncbi:MAG: hypothetical protein EZS28_018420 [Streblomastix strix]|uniref:Uncharacterized protein n=1 Tax=Streblomastix strix TaxID=222440 RepID=A0A5J4VTQ8_9EUKA|nr:MAG: hypothetical protein EZS28_018420 [Streblomastix strix]
MDLCEVDAAKEKIQRRTNCTSKRPPNRDSYQTLNCANLVPQNPLQVAEHLQQTFMKAFRVYIEHIHKHTRHDLQNMHDASADGHDNTREPAENATFTSNTSRVQQLDAEIVASIVLD